MRRAAKKDVNHNEIEKLFNVFGWITIDTSSCHGVLLDFIAYKPDKGFWFVEVKNGNKYLTKDETMFFEKHPERSIMLRSLEYTNKFLKEQK